MWQTSKAGFKSATSNEDGIHGGTKLPTALRKEYLRA